MTLSLKISVPKNEIHIANEFLKIYEPYVYQGCVEENKREISKIKDRTCRFCNKTSKEVTFRKDAHIIPKAIGSKKFLTAEECDECNLRFGVYENSLSTFIGAARTLDPIGNSLRKPQYQSNNGNIQIRNYGKLNLLKRNDLSKDFQTEGNNIVVNFETQKYIPEHLYRALLKIAISALPLQVNCLYTKAKNLLFSENACFPEIKKCFLSESNVYSPYPFALIYKRKKEVFEKIYPLHVFCLYCYNLMFQIFLPYPENDFRKNNHRICFQKAPFVVLGCYSLDDVETSFQLIELSSVSQSVRKEGFQINIKKDEKINFVSIKLNEDIETILSKSKKMK